MDYKESLNLPKTDFPMKANLSQREPEMLPTGRDDIYARIREHPEGGSLTSSMTAPPTRTAASTWARRSTRSSRTS